MNLTRWLQRISDATSCEPKQGTIDVYLEELSGWKLTDDQWEELRRRVIRSHRIPRCLPLIPDLSDLRDDILQRDRARESTRLAMERPEDVVPCPPEVKAQMEEMFRKGAAE